MSNCITLKARSDYPLIKLGITEIKDQILDMLLTASLAGVRI
jgi:hypothetical protein